MKDAEGVRFLQWALPKLGMRWEGFRKPRRQVLRRIGARASALGLAGLEEYRRRLEEDPLEWRTLATLCRVTISRFCRDRGVWDALREEVLPALIGRARAEGRGLLHAWSAGSASGEEPATLRLVWELGLDQALKAGTRLHVVATERDPLLLERARRGAYRASSLRELPDAWIDEAFDRRADDEFVMRAAFAEGISYRRGDVRRPPRGEAFDLVLCRNLVFTYFDEGGQRAFLEALAAELRPGAALVVGAHERLPEGVECFAPHPSAHHVFVRRPGEESPRPFPAPAG